MQNEKRNSTKYLPIFFVWHSLLMSAKVNKKFHYHFLLQNYWANFNKTWYKVSLMNFSSNEKPHHFTSEDGFF